MTCSNIGIVCAFYNCMPRRARIVIPGIPHHITQRGNRRQRSFFSQNDYQFYLKSLKRWKCLCEVEVLAYCLMPNHVHLVCVPPTTLSLARCIGEVHKAYSRRVNRRAGWKGYLWQGRFASYAMDVCHLFNAIRYVERNPVKAKLVTRAVDYKWSSARAHILGLTDGIVSPLALKNLIPDWQSYIAETSSNKSTDAIKKHLLSGRPLGGDLFVNQIERKFGVAARVRKVGRPKKRANR